MGPELLHQVEKRSHEAAPLQVPAPRLAATMALKENGEGAAVGDDQVVGADAIPWIPVARNKDASSGWRLARAYIPAGFIVPSIATPK